MSVCRVLVAVALATFAVGCRAETPRTEPGQAEPTASATPTGTSGAAAVTSGAAAVTAAMAPTAPAPTRYQAPGRLVAIGDVHGDLSAAHAAFRAAGATDAEHHWIGGDLTIVQTGDVLDRGDDELEILQFLDALALEADAAGGRIIRLTGNHELMNVMGDMRYVTAGGLADFSKHATVPQTEKQANEMVAERIRAFEPGSAWAHRFAAGPVVAIVNDTLFVHGGIEPQWAADLDTINAEVFQWLISGEAGAPPEAVIASDGPAWSRRFSDEFDETDCDALTEALEIAGVQRMVVAHTVQERGITSACEQRVWRIDTGMAKHYSGVIEVLEISGQTAEPVRGARISR